MLKRLKFVGGLLILLLIVAGCDSVGGGDGQSAGSNVPANAIEISIIYAPESQPYMETFIPAFNEAYRQGTNPVTGEPLEGDERPIHVTGQDGSSGTIMQGVVNAVRGINSENLASPTIFQPSVSHWLALANFQANREVFDLSESRATANAPVVMAIWESRLNAIQETVGYEDIGWEELLMVLDAPAGWQDFGIENGRRTVYYGHTDPFVSSTALSTLIAEYYAAAREEGYTERRLTMEMVEDEAVRDGVRGIENLIRHYSRRTTEFKNYIAQGPDYLDFVALEENDLIAINRGQTEFQPPEKLVALYPKEGTFWHEHPMGIVNADWTTPEQREAATVFVDYVLLPEQQEVIMSHGFRPVNPDVTLGFPFEEQFGVTAQGPTSVLDVPDPEVILEVQESWALVKKQADVMLLIDISGSMAQDNKLEQAKTAARTFLENMEAANRVGLTVFDTQTRVLVPLDNLEANRNQILSAIDGLQPQGGTALYDALVNVLDTMNAIEDSDRIRSVVFLSDGEDVDSVQHTLDSAEAAIRASQDSLNPVVVIPVGYGSLNDRLIRVLDRLADAANTQWQSGDPDSILDVLDIISSYF